MTDALDPATAAALLAKLDRAIRIIEEAHRVNPQASLEIAIAELESLRAYLMGQKPN
jgi:hypothetical protein